VTSPIIENQVENMKESPTAQKDFPMVVECVGDIEMSEEDTPQEDSFSE
jgi:hypothetical protein